MFSPWKPLKAVSPPALSLLARIVSPGFFQPLDHDGRKSLCIFDNLLSEPYFEANLKVIKILYELARS